MAIPERKRDASLDSLLNESAEAKFAREMVSQLRDAGFEALWAGGCVRDLIMGNRPTDYDVATSATPEQVRNVFGRRRTLPVGIAFGVVIVLGPSKQAGQVEVATFRTDATYSDGRHPDYVSFSTPREDALRRDFTINGMFLDPLNKTLIDYVGGERDLQLGLIRAIGDADARIAEDKLRMLRAIRFAARFSFSIESATRDAIAEHAREVTFVSGERVCMEIRKTLETQRVAWAVGEWSAVGLLPLILPEVDSHWSAYQTECQLQLQGLSSSNWLARLGVLLWLATGSERVAVENALSSLRSRLKISNDESEALRFALLSQLTLQAAERKPWSMVQPLLVHRHAKLALELFESRTLLSADAVATVQWLRRHLELPAAVLDPPPLLDGSDLIHLGLRPGPDFRKWLERARQLQLDGELADRSAALNWLRQAAL